MPSLITLLPTQRTISVAEGETILDAALRAGLNIPHSCKAGHCSSCRARILQGTVAYPSGRRPLGLMQEEEQAGHALLCQARAASAELTVEVRQIPPPPLDIQPRSLPCRIERMQPLASDVMAVFLRLPASEPFTFMAGQYIDIMLAQNRRRSFSIANPPHDAELLELHIRRVAGGEFTEQLFTGMKEKTLLRVEGPLGQFWFREESPRPALMIGGGTGYAPLRAMLLHLLERGDRRPLHLYWGAQTRDGLYEDAAIRELCARFPNLSYAPVLSIDGASSDAAGDSSTSRSEQEWHGRTGWVHTAAFQDHPNLQAFDIYASGPPAMVEAVRHELTERGVSQEQLFFDSFDYAPR